MLKFFFKGTVFTLGFILISELIFTFFLPASKQPYLKFNREFGLRNFDTSLAETGLFTFGNFSTRGGVWKINNLGWNSGIDYIPANERKKPMIAILGASYIESFHVDYDKNIRSSLQQQLNDKFDVATFAISGSPLSEMIQINRYVNKIFDPEIVVVKLSPVSISQSIQQLEPERTIAYQIVYQNGGFIERPVRPYQPSRFKRFFRFSALVSYLFYNRKIYEFLSKWRPGPKKPVEKELIDGVKRDKLLAEAAEYLIESLTRENNGKPVILLGDANREIIYSDQSGSASIEEILLLAAECKKYPNCQYLDLEPYFRKSYQENGQRFDWDHDHHWNEKGHRIAASALAELLEQNDYFRQQ